MRSEIKEQEAMAILVNISFQIQYLPLAEVLKMKKFFYVPFIAALTLSCTMTTGDTETATITVRVPAISRSVVQELGGIPERATIYEVFLGEAPDTGDIQRSGPVEPDETVAFTVLPHREYSVFALAGVPDTDGYSYLGGGVHPEIISVGAGEHRDITIILSPLQWRVTMDYTDADEPPRNSRRPIYVSPAATGRTLSPV